MTILLLGILGSFLGVGWLWLGLTSGAANTAHWLSWGDLVVLEIEGAITGDVDDVLRDLQDLAHKDRIKAIVLRLNSPGGGVAASQEIYQEVRKLAEHKVVVVSMASVAASGAYYIAAAADFIVANPSTVTGSLGVIMESVGVYELVGWAKLESRVLKTGKFKDVGSPFRPMTTEEQEFLLGVLDDMNEQFRQAVSTGRKIPMADLIPIADGRFFTGRQALNLKLVDHLGTIYDAIDKAKELAGLPQDAKVIWPAEERGFFYRTVQRTFLQLAGLLWQSLLEKSGGSYLFEGGMVH